MSGMLNSIKGFGYRPSQEGDELFRQRRVWDDKTQVRSFYELQVFPRIVKEIEAGGVTVEVGAGSGTLKDSYPDLIASDIVLTPWIDLRCNASRLPFGDKSITQLVGVNVLHHIFPLGDFLREMERTLKHGGRGIFVEPWITPISRVFYRLFHQEDCHPVINPFYEKHPDVNLPMRGNTYLPFQMTKSMEDKFTCLRIKKIEMFSCLGWCLSKGFRPDALMPDNLLRFILRIENRTEKLWGWLAALNALLIIERTPG